MPNSAPICRAKLAGGLLAGGQQLEQPPADRVPQDVECVHAPIFHYLPI